jgi:hypothetical protein
MGKRIDRTRDCGSETRAGRLAKAHQFMDAANTIETLADDATDVADAYVTMCVHAGIAAADVICCARLGKYSRGEDHGSAIELLEQADSADAKHLIVARHEDEGRIHLSPGERVRIHTSRPSCQSLARGRRARLTPDTDPATAVG